MKDRLADLRRLGAGQFDGPGLRLLETLITRAESLKGQAAEQALEKAQTRLELFEARFFEARSRCEALLEELKSAQEYSLLQEKYLQGRLKDVELEALQRLNAAGSEDVSGERARIQKLWHLTKQRAISLDFETRSALERLDAAGAVEAGAVEAGAVEAVWDRAALHALGDRLAEALFRDASNQARASGVVTRAQNRVPEARGPYNPESLSATCLQEISSLSPGYLHALVSYLSELQSLEVLAEPKRRLRR